MSATLFVLNRRVAFGTLKAGSLFKRGIVIRQQRCNFGTTVAVTSDPETEKYRMTTIRLYRVLQRTCKSFPVESKQDPILLQQELKAPDWGHHSIFTPPSPTMVEELYRLFYVYNDPTDDAAFAPTSIDDWYFNVVGKVSDEDMPPMTTFTCWTSPEQLRYAIRAAFRLNYDLDAPILHKWAIRAIQILQEQRTMWTSSSVATAEGIRVTATSRYVVRQGFRSFGSTLVLFWFRHSLVRVVA